MILADTSVWVEHIARPFNAMRDLLRDQQVIIHPFVIGELACGNLPDRPRFLAALHELPTAEPVEHVEAINLLQLHKFHGTGLGWVDVHLLAAAKAHSIQIWALDKRLNNAAHLLKIAYE